MFVDPPVLNAPGPGREGSLGPTFSNGGGVDTLVLSKLSRSEDPWNQLQKMRHWYATHTAS